MWRNPKYTDTQTDTQTDPAPEVLTTLERRDGGRLVVQVEHYLGHPFVRISERGRTIVIKTRELAAVAEALGRALDGMGEQPLRETRQDGPRGTADRSEARSTTRRSEPARGSRRGDSNAAGWNPPGPRPGEMSSEPFDEFSDQ